MHLQGQARAWLDLEALDLEAGSVLDAVVAAPGAEDLAVQRMLIAALLLEPVDELLHVLHAIPGRDQHGILRLDDHMILEANHRDQPAPGIEIAPL